MRGKRTRAPFPQELLPMKIENCIFRAQCSHKFLQSPVCGVGQLIKHGRTAPSKPKVQATETLRHQRQPADLIVRLVESQIVRTSNINDATLANDASSFSK